MRGRAAGGMRSRSSTALLFAVFLSLSSAFLSPPSVHRFKHPGGVASGPYRNSAFASHPRLPARLGPRHPARVFLAGARAEMEGKGGIGDAEGLGSIGGVLGGGTRIPRPSGRMGSEDSTGSLEGQQQPTRSGSQGDIEAPPNPGGGYFRRSSLMREPTKRVQKLRDVLFQKEAFEVLTNAEFSLKLDMSGGGAGATPEEEEMRNIASIDYDKISRSLSILYESIQSSNAGKTVMREEERSRLADKLLEMQVQVQQRMREGKGITSVARFDDVPQDIRDEEEKNMSWGEKLQLRVAEVQHALSPDNIRAVFGRFRLLGGAVRKQEETLETYMQAFVREDGSLDFDAVKVPKREELVRFGGELWERLNGMPPGEEPAKNITALKLAIKSSPKILELQEKIRSAEEEEEDIKAIREEAFTELDEFRQGGYAKYEMVAVMESDSAFDENSEVSQDSKAEDEAGAAKMKTEESKYARGLSSIMSKLRRVEKNLLEAEQRLALQRLDLDMERIAIYIQYDIEESEEVQDQQKLLVAEVGLLDSQIRSLRQMSEEGASALLQDLDDGMSINRVGLVDEGELLVVAGDVGDLLRRLGVDQVLEEPDFSIVPKFSWQEFQQKAADGAVFYVEGTRLLASDWGYSAGLIFKAAFRGQTLSPREVRTLRRAFKDTTTFIPFIIILIIPLTPVGHVLVFSFIQRFFPDFFPSPYTDRRQKLLRMYQAVEMSMPANIRVGGGGAPRMGSIVRTAPGRRMRSTKTLLERSQQEQERLRRQGRPGTIPELRPKPTRGGMPGATRPGVMRVPGQTQKKDNE